MIKKIFLLLSIFIAFGSTTLISANENICNDFYKDCALGEDYIDVNERMEKVLNTTPYSSGIQEYFNFTTSYFDNLTYNFGMNYKGSCGYIAIAMMLSYYDTYLSDSIVPEQYDVSSNGEGTNMILRRNSPGAMKDIISDPYYPADAYVGFNQNAHEYYSSILSLSNQSLHAKLITIGAALGYYDFTDDVNPCGTNYNMRYNVINEYFSSVLNMTYGYQYTFDECNGEASSSLSNSVRDFAITQVSLGKPVLLSMSKSNGGHVAVAYDYDAKTDKLYCHMGWNASTTHSTIEDCSYTRYKSALSININLSHNHSNNYGVTTITNNVSTTNNYCFHDSQILTYFNCGGHTYNDHFEYYSEEKHKAYCSCGHFVLKSHSVKPGSTRRIRGHLYATCADCGALIDLGKTIVVIDGIDLPSYVYY